MDLDARYTRIKLLHTKKKKKENRAKKLLLLSWLGNSTGRQVTS
jgi:hypothetical protein